MAKLCFVEASTRRYGRFNLSYGVTDEDILLVDRLYSICQGKTWETRGSFGATLAPDAKAPDKIDGEVSMEIDSFGEWELFGVKIQLGKVMVTLSKPDSRQFLTALKHSIDTGNPRVELKEISAIHK